MTFLFISELHVEPLPDSSVRGAFDESGGGHHPQLRQSHGSGGRFLLYPARLHFARHFPLPTIPKLG